MKNIHLDLRTQKDIDAQIERVHRDLGYRDGKINLVEVRELLRLDIAYYRLDDPDILDGVVHKLRIGVKQVAERPQLLLEAVRKFDLKALFLPDRKRILIDDATPDLKKRWSESHEVAHSLIPWHADYMFGDDGTTLSPTCHDRIEAEANYGAGRLLFPGSSFNAQRRSGVLSLSLVRNIAAEFGNTITSTLWRCVEHHEEPAFAMVSAHPRAAGSPEVLVEHFIRSVSFSERFVDTEIPVLWGLMRQYCGHQQRGPLGSKEVVIRDQDGNAHLFFMETFSVTHSVLTLGRYVRPLPIAVHMPPTQAA